MKTHFATDQNQPDCGRGKVVTGNVSRVTCELCTARPAYQAAKQTYDDERLSAFLAQTPRTFSEPWRDGKITCFVCKENLFRMGDRTCYGHYENYVCANCGHTESRLTETGMSF